MNKIWIAVLAACLVTAADAASADEWNDRTILTFSAPVMVPGTTLPAGTYVFELADASGNRHLVRIRREGSSDIVATTQAVPTKRTDPKGDVVVQFNPTGPGAAPAMKAWFYPGSAYGHEFVYPDDQARLIAERTKSIVLSVDVPGTDLEKGVLRVHSASGTPAAWRGDEATMGEWDAWQRARGARANEAPQATAPAVSAAFQGTRVGLNDLEENPSRYIGQRISVDGEVEEVYGPRLFTIDEPHWGDLDGEILVLLPTLAAALVKDNDRVTISGTVRPFMRAEIEREWGWLGVDPSIDVEVGSKPILVAERLIGGDNNVAMVIEASARGAAQPVGTSGAAPATTNADAIATADAGMVGERVRLTGMRISGTAADGGFFVAAGNRHIFVLPAQPVTAASGDTFTIDGVILQMPRSMLARLKGPAGLNETIYVYATGVSR